MRIEIERKDVADFATPLLAVGLFEGADALTAPVEALDRAMGGAIAAVVKRGDFKGKLGETMVLYPSGDGVRAERVLLVGVGKGDGVDAERIRRAGGAASRAAAKLGVDRMATTLHHVSAGDGGPSDSDAAQALVEGLILGAYVFDRMKTSGDEPDTRLDRVDVLEKSADRAKALEPGIRVGTALARGENTARELGNLPGNIATPTYLAERAEEIGREHGMKVTALGPRELEKEGLHALLAVSAGSEQEPRLIVMEHRKGPKGSKPIVLLGKGLTFDAGGISIKPAMNMEDMKFDMCGGAAVIGAMQAVGELGLEIDVVGVVPSSENLLSGRAMKPGDILRTHLGKTIEVVNTDAEGRLILADALSYLRRFDPAAVVDAATLTGACVIALGHQASAAMTNDVDLMREIRAAGERAGQRVWELPMLEEYREQIESIYADIKNSGGRPAGTITAGWFLREFVGDFPWVHLDVAGTAFGEGKLPYQRKGATGVPTRLFVEWVRARTG